MRMKASLKLYRQQPRKVKLIADAIRGKRIAEVRSILSLVGKRAAGPVLKLVESAVANAKQQAGTVNEEELVVKEISVDKGLTLHRMRPRARGAAYPIKKRTSNITLSLAEQKRGNPKS